MKEFTYYSTPTAEFFGHDGRKEFRRALEHEINNTPMTASERASAMSSIKDRLREHTEKMNREYYRQGRELDAEFWKDAREELGYSTILSEEAISVLESTAWDEGHASGYGGVFDRLQSLSEFAELVIKSTKVGDNP